ncbi:hypothetical protein BV25DRAFT_1577251 [Artomyces pyxidatus]|uniref:Uncharacterized protein n=1 Tax=Artomyces pyxidatus TaxID=48021 RepID=A0ACB8SIS7_9AGAM|nr:hypothetical protein BV25DRAFT_1577251 [Artomyces pyxidatus]
MSTSATTPPPDSLPLLVAQYAITGHFRRTEHWSLIVPKSRAEATLFELHGQMDAFVYKTEPLTAFSSAPDLRGGVQVGWVPRARLEDGSVSELLARGRIVRNDRDFDCQLWIMEALESLRKEGWLFETVNEDWVREELKLDYTRWEKGEDTVDKRLFPEA